MVQNPSDQAVQSAPIGAANRGLMNDPMDVDVDIADPAAAVADAVADAAEDPPPHILQQLRMYRLHHVAARAMWH